MNVREAIQVVRQARTADDAVQFDGTPGTRAWSDPEIIAAYAEAQNEACERANLLRDQFTDRVTLVTIVANQVSYALHPSIYAIDDVRYEHDGRVLRVTSQEELDQGGPRGGFVDAYGYVPGVPMGAWASRQGTRSGYYFVQRTARERLVLRPFPIGNEATYTLPNGDPAPLKMRLSVYRRAIWPLKAPTDVPEINERYHINLLDWVLGRLYEKNDSDANNDNRSAMHYARFDAVFGPKLDADIQRTRFERRVETCRPYGIT